MQYFSPLLCPHSVLNQHLHICSHGDARSSENLRIWHQSGLEAGSVCGDPRGVGKGWGGLAPRDGGWLEPQGHQLTGEWGGVGVRRQDSKLGLGSVWMLKGEWYCFLCQCKIRIHNPGFTNAIFALLFKNGKIAL